MASGETHQLRGAILRITKRPAVDNISIQEESKRARTHPSSGPDATPAQPTMETIHDRDRPLWPANGITAEASLLRISELERGNEDEKLMAMFARHVIKPERRHRPRQKWISKRTLRHTFPEHFINSGFLVTSTWASKSAEEFGLPDLFLRGVDERTARLVLADDIVHLLAEADRGPDIDALSAGELDWLENRIDNYPVTSPADLQSEEDQLSEDSDDGNDTVFSSFGRPRRVRGRTFESQSSYRLGDIGTDRQRHDVASSTIDTGQIEQVEDSPHVSDHAFATVKSNENERSVRPKHRSPTSTGLETRASHETHSNRTIHTVAEALMLAPSSTNAHGHPPLDVKTTAVPLTPDDSQAAISLLTPKISEILRDFPTSHEDPAFMLLLRDVVKSTITGDTKSIEDSMLELETHVVTTTVNKPSNNPNEMAVLARPILEALRKWLVQDPAINCSETRLKINRMSMARDFDGLRNMHAGMLIWEARSKQPPT
ncbi:hypothetical protein D6D10_02020 [Aureobasidium pullulans]|uniref:Uncharacterized protein n=1 Tax=Aureobasidium pullulans TaxID=5580 RepID=A0A4S9F4Y6_AURPU|nr:hypothetical protein D6D10_02020 [Aureobasidium pullulans]